MGSDGLDLRGRPAGAVADRAGLHTRLPTLATLPEASPHQDRQRSLLPCAPRQRTPAQAATAATTSTHCREPESVQPPPLFGEPLRPVAPRLRAILAAMLPSQVAVP